MAIWILRQIEREREIACDDWVVAQTGNARPYAASLLRMFELRRPGRRDLLAPGVFGRTSRLGDRIELLLRRGREFSPRASFGRVAISALALLAFAAAGSLAPRWIAFAQSPQFEVASLRPNNDCENMPRFGSLSPSPGRLEMPCFTLQSMVQDAYGTFSDGVSINSQLLHIEGGPSWMRTEYYSLSAKAEGPARTEMLAGPMLRSFLEERFRLKTHTEIREAPVFAMTVGKGGLRVGRLAEGACSPIDLAHPPAPPKPGEPPPNVCGLMRMGPSGNGDMMMEVRGSTMTQFAQRLSGRVDRVVVDKTGVTGMYNFHLEFTPDPDVPGPDLFAALHEQIGLKLSSDKGSVSFLIIDHVEKPTAN